MRNTLNNILNERWYTVIFDKKYFLKNDYLSITDFIYSCIENEMNVKIIDSETEIFIKVYDIFGIIEQHIFNMIFDDIKNKMNSYGFSNTPTLLIDSPNFHSEKIQYNQYVYSNDIIDEKHIYTYHSKNIDCLETDIIDLVEIRGIRNIELIFDICDDIDCSEEYFMNIVNKLFNLLCRFYDNGIWKQLKLFPYRMTEMISLYDYGNNLKSSIFEKNYYEQNGSIEINPVLFLNFIGEQRCFNSFVLSQVTQHGNYNKKNDEIESKLENSIKLAWILFIDMRYNKRNTEAEKFILDTISPIDEKYDGLLEYYQDCIKI